MSDAAEEAIHELETEGAANLSEETSQSAAQTPSTSTTEKDESIAKTAEEEENSNTTTTETDKKEEKKEGDNGTSFINLDDMTEQYRQAANRAFGSKDYSKAIGLYTQCIMLNLQDVKAWSNRSAARLRSGDIDLALYDADRVVDLDPDWAKGHYRRGRALFKLHRYAEAVTAFERANSLSPDNEDVKMWLNETVGWASFAHSNPDSEFAKVRKERKVVRNARKGLAKAEEEAAGRNDGNDDGNDDDDDESGSRVIGSDGEYSSDADSDQYVAEAETDSEAEEWPLPPGWVKTSTKDGYPYYANYYLRTSAWERPDPWFPDDEGNNNEEKAKEVRERVEARWLAEAEAAREEEEYYGEGESDYEEESEGEEGAYDDAEEEGEEIEGDAPPKAPETS